MIPRFPGSRKPGWEKRVLQGIGFPAGDAFLSGPDTPVTSGVPVQEPFGNHVPANRTEIVMEIRNDDVYFPLRIDAVVFKCVCDHFQDNALLLPLGRDEYHAFYRH